MARPQFTLRTMFLSVSYFAVAFGLHHLAGMTGGLGILLSMLVTAKRSARGGAGAARGSQVSRG
jgi:hypothetical protein